MVVAFSIVRGHSHGHRCGGAEHRRTISQFSVIFRCHYYACVGFEPRKFLCLVTTKCFRIHPVEACCFVLPEERVADNTE